MPDAAVKLRATLATLVIRASRPSVVIDGIASNRRHVPAGRAKSSGFVFRMKTGNCARNLAVRPEGDANCGQ
jgi:hypothetical protein